MISHIYDDITYIDDTGSTDQALVIVPSIWCLPYPGYHI